MNLRTSLVFPLLFNLFIYTYYYNKYEFTVNSVNTYVPLIKNMVSKSKTFFAYYCVILFSIALLVYSFYYVGKYLHLWAFIYFYLIILIHIICYQLLRKSSNSESYSQLIQGAFFGIFGILLFIHSYYYFKRHDTYVVQMSLTSSLLTIGSVLVFFLANWYGAWKVQSNKLSLPLYLKGYNRFLFVLLYVFFIVCFLKLKWLDYAVSCFFAIYAMLIGRRTIIKWRNHEYS